LTIHTGSVYIRRRRMRDFAEEIRTVRTRLGYTQSEFAERLGVAFRTIQEWEGGRNRPHHAHLILVAARALPKSKTPRAGRPGRRPGPKRREK
jgi:transcriptional regulator with XRE-family HTH domain